MIARIWEGKTKIEHSRLYSEIIQERDMPNYQKAIGFVKSTFLKRSDDEYTYFKLLTFWVDFKAVRAFAGPDFEQAVSYEADEPYLVDCPGHVMHYEVFAEWN